MSFPIGWFRFSIFVIENQKFNGNVVSTSNWIRARLYAYTYNLRKGKYDRAGTYRLLDNGMVTHRVDNQQPIGDGIEGLK